MNMLASRRGILRRLSLRAALVLGGGVVVLGAGLGVTVYAVADPSTPPVPANATPATAQSLDPNASTFNGTTIGAATYTSSGTDSGLDTTGDSVWYTWTPADGGQILVLPAGSTGTTASLKVFTGTAGSFAPVTVTEVSGKTLFTAEAGTTYTFEVATTSGHDADFQYTLWATTSSAGPTNDAFAAAVSLNPAVTANRGTATTDLADGTLDGATTESDEPGTISAGDGTVWYSWTVPNDGASLDLSVSGSAVLDAYTLPTDQTASSSDGPTQAATSGLAALEAHGTSGTGSITVTGDAEQVVYLRVRGDAGSGSADDFHLSGTENGYAAPDVTVPVVSCDSAPATWAKAPTIDCQATDSGSGFAAATGLTLSGDHQTATFSLPVDVPANSTTSAAQSATQTICDVAGNCVTAGPVTGIKVDSAAPTVQCDPVPAIWQTTATVTVNCTADDGTGSGLDAADTSFTMTATGTAGQASDSVAFAPRTGPASGDAPTSDATLGSVCDEVGNCTPIALRGGSATHSGSSDGSVDAMIDLAPPVVTCDTGSLTSAWKSADVTVSCTATDDGSGLADATQDSFTLSTSVADATADSAAAFSSQSICDVAGNCVSPSVSQTVKVDRTAPVVDCTVPSAGTWIQGHTLSVPCTATDTGSGLDDASQSSFTLTGSIPAGSQSASVDITAVKVCDAAGNCASTPSVTGVGLDDKAPTIVCSPTPTGWTNAASVSDACTADDADGSGLANAGTDASFSLTSATVAGGSTNGSAPFGSRSVCDASGNCATSPTLTPAKIDRTTPTVSCEVPTTPAAGYFVSEVVVTCTASDGDSGLLDPAHATFTLSTSVGSGNSDGAALVSSQLVYDAAGNSFLAGASVPSFDVDRSQPLPAAPTFTDVPSQVTVLAAVDSGTTSVQVPLSQPSATSDLQLAVGCTPGNGGTFPIGTTVVTCTARDTADQTTDTDYPVDVAAAPQYAPSGPLSLDDALVVKGDGFSGPVSVELDGTTLTTVQPQGGVVNTTVDLPDGTATGSHLLVIRGLGADADPRLVVKPFVLTADPVPSDTDTSGPTPTGGHHPTSPITLSPSPTDSSSPSPSPSDSPTPPSEPTIEATVSPSVDRKAPFVFKVSSTLTPSDGSTACTGSATITEQIKVTRKVVVKGKRVKRTSWVTRTTRTVDFGTCSFEARFTLRKKQLPAGKAAVEVRYVIRATTADGTVGVVKTVRAR